MKSWRMDAQARSDLLDIYAHIADNNPRAADSLVDLFHEKFLLLAKYPLLGQIRPELFPELRSFSVKNYVIFYLPYENGVRIARIIHATRDIDAIF